MSSNITLAGNGHGCIACLKGLLPYYPNLNVVTEDEDVEALVQGQGKVYRTIEESPDAVVICSGWSDLVTEKTLAEKTVLNIHYSLLPKYRGLHSVVWALLNDEPEIGLTVHLIDKYIDNGDIIYQYAKKVEENNISWDFMTHFNNHITENIGALMQDFIAGKITPQKQDKTQATWVPKRNLDDCKIDFTMSHRQLELFFRSLVRPYPVPHIVVRGQRVEITKYKLVKADYFTTLGRVVNIDEEGAWIKTQEGLLVVEECYTEEKGAFSPASLLKMGQRLR